MSRNYWVVSDTHFQHEFIIEADFARRKFSNSKEMDECMIDNWNSVVKPGDKIYHCGDVLFGQKEGFKERIWSKLQGHKKLIIGNHDDMNYIVTAKLFHTIDYWKKLRDFGVILSHVPLHPETLQETRWGGNLLYNVHGHTHSNGSPVGPYKSVCVELIDYTPVNLEEIRDSLRNETQDNKNEVLGTMD